MEDVAPALITDVIDEFHRLYEESDKIRVLLGKVKEGTATFAEAQQYSLEVSRLIGVAYGHQNRSCQKRPCYSQREAGKSCSG